ncbi:N-acetylneuraminate synthase family protein [Methanobrevibacter sp.]|uniref:N-acetylneuraminate synthase family protein n=1 Tax=Methanobrevibacter sp. TaxID=66852 RepID=UPI0025DC11CF|nr:N-acetylneuraminate synthase family protein [Methanobrevibacter sp.]MBQ2831935.1 N-acetylneuraminate synthase family protein [Methanobrevibacter sp.]
MNIFNKKPFLIANISFNFYDLAKKENISYMDAAKLLIDDAQLCGVDAVIFHAYDVEKFISRDSPSFWNLSLEESVSQFELFNKYGKFGIGEYRKLAQYCSELGIKFLSEPLDFESVDLLDDFVDVYKISSSDLTNIPFVKHVASKNKSILLSTGGATLIEIKNAINAIEDVSTSNIAIMHSILSYPTEYKDANLLMIKDLVQNFPDYEIGYVDYTKPDKDMMVLTTAYSYGATILEKHFTFDKTLGGYYNTFAMDPDDVIHFKNNALFLSRINGFTNKQPLICESYARKEIRKSIVAKRDIKKGETISESDISFKRPGKGISPAQMDDVVGKIANRNIEKNTFIDFGMLD